MKNIEKFIAGVVIVAPREELHDADPLLRRKLWQLCEVLEEIDVNQTKTLDVIEGEWTLIIITPMTTRATLYMIAMSPAKCDSHCQCCIR